MSTIKNQVFIGGCGRSGTTFLGSILGASRDAIVVPETMFKTRVLQDPHQSIHHVEAIFDKIQKDKTFKYWKVDVTQLNLAEIRTYPELLLHIVDLYNQKARKNDYHTWIDHTPNNIYHTKLLLELFPDAKFIHLVRDGRAVANSVMPLDWGPNTIHTATTYWTKYLSHGLAAELNLGSEKVIRVKYEDLVLHPEKTVRTICDFTGIEFSMEMLQADGLIKTEYTESQHKLVGKKADVSRIDSWKKNLSQREIEIFECMTYDLLFNLGYELQFEGRARKVSNYEIALADFYDYFKKIFVKIPVRKIREFKNS